MNRFAKLTSLILVLAILVSIITCVPLSVSAAEHDLVTVSSIEQLGDISVCGNGGTVSGAAGTDNWLNGSFWDPSEKSNVMTEIREDVFSISFSALPALSNYQFKFLSNYDWYTCNWGENGNDMGDPTYYQGTGVESDARFFGSNILFAIATDNSIVEIRLDITDFDLSVLNKYTKNVSCGSKYTVNIFNSDGTPVSGYYGKESGDYQYVLSGDDAIITKYNGTATRVTVPDSIDGHNVVEIGGGAFANNSSINEIGIPEGVTYISVCAFYNCPSLIKVTLPESMVRIASKAFSNCSNLELVNLSDNVCSLDNDTFLGCSKLKIKCIPSSYAFNYAIENNIQLAGTKYYNLIVLNSNGEKITSDYNVNWYEKDSDEVIGVGSKIFGLDEKKDYQYEIQLGESLSLTYLQPKRQDVISIDDVNIYLTLKEYSTISVSGTIIDSEKNHIEGAKVSFRQILSNNYEKNTEVITNANGEFTTEIANVPTDAYITSIGYYKRTTAILNETLTLDKINIGEITLSKLPENKITIQLYKNCAALPGAEHETIPIISADGLGFSLYNLTKNRPIVDYSVEYPYIVLDDREADAGDVLQLEIVDEQNNMIAARQTLKLNQQRNGSCTMEFSENGRIYVESVTGNESNTMMLFSSDGKFIQSASIFSGFTSNCLSSGNYKVVFIKKTELLKGFRNISSLTEFGLSEDKDYILKDIYIQNGVIKNIGAITVPSLDESNLYYVLPEYTSITTSSSKAYVGRYITVRCEYRIKDKYSSNNESVTFDLPDDVEIIKGSMTVDGKLSSFNIHENTVSTITNNNKGIIRFYVVATDKGQKDISATLSFSCESEKVVQPLGTADFSAETGNFKTPSITSNKNITVTGTTMYGSTVTVYDNNTEVGTTVANKVGSWSLLFELINPDECQYHEIYCKIQNVNISKPVFSESQITAYEPDLTEVSSVTMINTAHPATSMNTVEYSTIIDFRNSSGKITPYRYWSKYPTFTFKVDFIGNESNLRDVSIVTKNSSGEKTYIEAVYDDNSNAWIGTHDFINSASTPVSVAVRYVDLNSLVTTMTLEQLKGMNILNERKENNVVSFDVSNGGDLYSFTIYPLDEKPSYLPGNSMDYKVVTELDFGDNCNMLYNEKEDTTVITYDNQYMVIRSNEEKGDVEESNYNNTDLVPTGVTINRDTLGLNGVSGQEIARRVRNMMNDLENGRCDFEPESELLPSVFRGEMNARRNAFLFGAGVNAANLVNTAIGYDRQHPFISAFSTGYSIGGIPGNYNDLRNITEANMRRLLQLYYELENNYGCHPDDDPPGDETDEFDTPRIDDPSGYIYEAVPSNRIEGVRAEAYYYDYALDEFGVQEDEKSDILWDAENYDQVNPLYTDSNGEYAWDVPVGQWLVKFSKDGYYDTDSKLLNIVDEDGYLPVPPPQTEVNVGMVSKASPTVDEICVFDNEIRIVFSQYMKLDSVSNKTVTIQMNGKAIEGTVTPLNAEFDYDNVYQYASKFRFVPKTSLTGNVNVTVNGAINYAGTKMKNTFTHTGQVNAKPESISVDSKITVTYNSGALLEVDILPKKAGAGLIVNAVSSSPSIVDVVNSSVVTDANGHANIMLEGKLPGQGEITLSVSGSDLTQTVLANVSGVVSVNDRCEKVTTSIASGSTVEAGTLLELSTTTEGADIYYTLDGSCPCSVESPSRIKYTEPIRVDENTFVIAYAVKDGMQDSYTAGFNYFVPIPVADVLLGDVDSDDGVSIVDATYIQRHLASIPIPFVLNETIADTDEDGIVSIMDATYIQRWLAQLQSNDNIGKPIS